MFKPEFPYKGNQLILTSDRVTLHSKNDAIFLFGKQAVSLSSPKTINLDATEKVLIYSPKIELGARAEQEGEPVVLGERLNEQLAVLTNAISTAGILLKQASTSKLGTAMESIREAGQILYDAAENSKGYLETKAILSQNTFTR
jgi:hypothetical protein